MNKLYDSLILIGFMGVGKSTVARLLSEQLSLRLVDLDHLINETHGEIFDLINEFGEAHFRILEYDMFQKCMDHSKCVIATGGGIVTHSPSFDLISKQPAVIWLKASFQTVQNRIQGDVNNQRPLADDQLLERFKFRQNIYQQCATLAIDVDGLTPQEVAESIINRYR